MTRSNGELQQKSRFLYRILGSKTVRFGAIMASFFGCGFARVAVKRSFMKSTGKVEYDQDNWLKNYLAVFQGHQERYEVDKHSYVKRSKSLVNHFGKWKLKTNKEKYTEHFSPNNWEKLTEYEKKQHTRTNCQACDVHHFPFQSLFPMWNSKENSLSQRGIDKNIKSRVRFMKKLMPHLKIYLG